MSKKTYKGYQLIKAIADGEIKEGSRFIDTYSEYIYRKDGMDEELTLYKKDEITGGCFIPDYSYFADNDNEFELIEEDTIDIDSIEELDIDTLHTNGFATDRIARKLNEVLQWAKQADKEIKKLSKKYCYNCGVELTEENTALPNMCNECKYGEE